MTRPISLGSRARRVAAGTAPILLAILGIGTPWTWAGVVPLMARRHRLAPLSGAAHCLGQKGAATCA